jgi:hypothetical protein
MQKPVQFRLSGLFAFRRPQYKPFKSEKSESDNLVFQQL